MIPKEKTPLALIATDAQRTHDSCKRQEKERLATHTKKLQELASALDSHNAFPEKQFDSYPRVGSLKGRETSTKKLLLVFKNQEAQNGVVLTPEGQLMKVGIGIKEAFYFWFGKNEYLEGQEFVQIAEGAYAPIAKAALGKLRL